MINKKSHRQKRMYKGPEAEHPWVLEWNVADFFCNESDNKNIGSVNHVCLLQLLKSAVVA